MAMPRISPDGTRVATQVRNTEQRLGIWVIDLERKLPTRVHAPGRGGADEGQLPQWSGDGRHLVFHLLVNGVNGIYRTSVTGLGTPELLMRSSAEAGGLAFPQDWSRDGRHLLYWVRGDRTRGDVWALPLTGDRKPIPVLNTEFDETAPVLSPDGRWIAYRSDASGTYEIYLQSFTTDGRAGGDRVRISTAGGRQPRFRGDGRELFYLADDGGLMAVGISGSGTIAGPGEPQALFKARVPPGDDRNLPANYDVSPDGQRFLINAVLEGGAPPAPTVVLNWTAALTK
jgi:Tol biopolymer transport system component